jgi:putative addiction module killer protein
MAELAIRFFVAFDGRVPVQGWLDSLDREAQAKISVALTRLANGNRSHVKGLGSGVAELKVDFGPGYRIYFGQDGPTLIILLAGGTKKRQGGDIATAKVRWADYKARKSQRTADEAAHGSDT